MRIKALCFALFAVFMSAGAVQAAQAMPDLTIESVKWEYVSGHGAYDGAMRPGDNIRVLVAVRNAGQAPAVMFPVVLQIRWVEGNVYKSIRLSKNISDINPQTTKTVIFKHNNVIFGEYMFTAWVDPNNKVKEYNERNNEKIGNNMPVIGNLLLKPDLMVTLYSPDASRHIRRKVLLRGKVSNVGKKESPPCYLTLKCGGKKDKTIKVPGLAKGQSYKFEFKHRWSTRGDRKCEVRADSKNNVDELNENNNWASLKVHIK
jgi:subtilase family serine protease